MKASTRYFPFIIALFIGSAPSNSQLFEAGSLSFSDSRDLIIVPGTGGTTGIAVADYNNDGFLDVYFVVHNQSFANDIRTQNRLFRFDGKNYTDRTSAAGSGAKGLADLIWSEYGYNIGASWGDYNNDGLPDLFLANTGPDILLKNNGSESFENVTIKAGVAGADSLQSSQGLWFDYDKDGDLDLYVSVRENRATSSNVRANRMYENIGDDQFLDVSAASGLADSGLTFTTLALDVNNDSHLDLYLANDFGENKLYLNNGDKTFIESTGLLGLDDRGEGMGLAIGDPDQNGFFDFYLTNVTESGESDLRFNRLFLNSGGNSFSKKEFQTGTSEAGWGWGTQFADFDNDGDEDLFVSNGYFTQNPPDTNVIFLNQFDGDSLKFQEIINSGITTPTVSFSQAIYDENGDGNLDILSSNFYQKPILYTNTKSTGNWIKIWLEGVQTNRNGFGSVIEAELNGTTIKRYYHGAGLYSQHVLPVHIGLGNAESIDKITVRWLNGQVDVVEHISVNQTIRIREFDGLVVSNESEEQALFENPSGIRLLGNYPNPFNAGTVIQFALSKPQEVRLEIFDVLGRQVYRAEHRFNSGNQSFRWNPINLNSGIYFYRISNSSLSKSASLLYLK